mgnify:FL=1
MDPTKTTESTGIEYVLEDTAANKILGELTYFKFSDSAKADLKIQPKVLPPPVTIVKSTKKTETCSRHVSQLLLRGEHIAYIVVIPDETKS